MHRNVMVRAGLFLMVVALFSQAFMAAASAQWDFPRLDEIMFKTKYPSSVSVEAAKACQIDTYVGATSIAEVNALSYPPYNWTDTASPGFHMCYIGINCRNATPGTSGGRVDYHGRTPGFQLYPLNLTAFRYALELIVGCNKTAWINDIYGYTNVRLDTCVPPANMYWYDPSIPPYPLDWNDAYNTLIAAGFSGTIGGDDWLMPNGQPLREPIYAMSPMEAPTSMETTRRHVASWNAFFCGQSVADQPHDCNFVHEPIDFYTEIDVAFYNRDHDMYFMCWGLSRDPDYLWWFFHPDADKPDWENSPGLNYRPLSAMIDALFYSMWTEKAELRIRGPGPMTVPASKGHYTTYAFVAGSEDVWIGVYSGAGGYPYRLVELQYGSDYEYVGYGSSIRGIRFLQNISLGADMYIHMVYSLEDQASIHSKVELKQICYDIQWMLYYMCPYLPVYSRNYHDLYKPGLEGWVPSPGYGSATYQLKWTYGSIRWTGAPVDGTVNWHLGGPVSWLNPLRTSSSYELTVLNRLYDSMLEVDAYTHADVPWLALNYQINDWTGPWGEPGMIVTFWIRDDIRWQDGDPVTADDFIWQLDFINSTRPSAFYGIFSTYHGCTKHNDYCYSVKINTTNLLRLYDYAGGLRFPRKVWSPFYGNKTSAEAFKPWLTPHPDGTLPTSLYGTGEWILDYWNTTTGTVRVYKNLDWWGRQAAVPCRQITGIYAPTTAKKGTAPKITKATIGLYAFNLDTEADCTSTWELLIDGEVKANGTLSLGPLSSASWWKSVPWQTLQVGLHEWTLRTRNVYGENFYSCSAYWLVGDVNDDNIVAMLDLYMVALQFGRTGPVSFSDADIDNNGVINMLDLYICSVAYATYLEPPKTAN